MVKGPNGNERNAWKALTLAAGSKNITRPLQANRGNTQSLKAITLIAGQSPYTLMKEVSV